MPLNFEWDEKKARTNVSKHGVRFEDAATILADAQSITIPDPGHSRVEDRFISLGKSDQGKLLLVVHTERGENVRIISARNASRNERKTYEKGI